MEKNNKAVVNENYNDESDEFTYLDDISIKNELDEQDTLEDRSDMVNNNDKDEDDEDDGDDDEADDDDDDYDEDENDEDEEDYDDEDYDKPPRKRKEFTGKAEHIEKVRMENDLITQWRPQLECDICNNYFPAVDLLKSHFRSEHNSRWYIKCCERKFYGRCVLVNHLRLHIDQNCSKYKKSGPYECKECHSTFETKRNLEGHLLSHVNGSKDFVCIKKVEDTHRCHECGETFYGIRALRIHQMEHHSANDSAENIQPLSSEIRDISHVKAKLESGEYKIVQKMGKSKVWEIFGEVEMNGSVNKKIVACRSCKTVYRFSSTSILVKHKCYRDSITGNKCEVDVDQHTKDQVAEALTQWTINNCRPLKMVDDDGLLKYTKLILSIGAKYGAAVEIEKMLPLHSTISQNIDKLYEQSCYRLQSEINTISGFAITTDLWTDDYTQTSYLALTIHFVKNAKLNTKLLGFESMNSKSCNSDKVLRKVNKTLQKFDCSIDKVMIVTDNNSNMKAVFSEYRHIYCFNHLLHNIVDKAIKEITIIDDLCKKCMKLVDYFKMSDSDAELTTALKSFRPTQCITIYFLLQSVHQNWVQIGKVLQQKNQIFRISGININLMKQVMDVLQSFAKTSKKLEADSYPTFHLAMIHVHFLKRLCEEDINDEQSCIKDFKGKLNNLLSEVVMKNLTIYHKIAVFLFPPTNKMLQFSSDEKTDIKKHCKDMMENFANDSAPVQANSAVPLSIENERIFAGFLPSSVQTYVSNRMQSELSAYENVHEVLHDGFDVLLWWRLNKTKFPLLYQVSCKIFAIPASNGPSERAFLSARKLLCENRGVNDRNSISVEKIIFLHHNMKMKNA